MLEGSGDSRSQVVSLMRERDDLEAEILNLLNELKKHNIGLNEPLIDAEGFPRNDIDIYAVRLLRNKIICKTNDCKSLTKKIEEGLHTLHSEENVSNDNLAGSTKEDRVKPFARVDVVDENSPAEKAELQAGDLILKFDSVTARNFQNLASLAAIVANSIKRPIRVNVLRNNDVVPLILIPEEWSGPGYLGCKLLPL